MQSVDFFRTFIDDPFIFGEIAAVHALGDVWAMGAKPHSALALAVVPAAAERLMEEDLFQMLSGARRCGFLAWTMLSSQGRSISSTSLYKNKMADSARFWVLAETLRSVAKAERKASISGAPISLG